MAEEGGEEENQQQQYDKYELELMLPYDLRCEREEKATDKKGEFEGKMRITSAPIVQNGFFCPLLFKKY